MSEHRAICLAVIEDNPADVQLLRFALEEAGLDCELVVLYDGQAALEWVRRNGNEGARPAKAVVLDLNLPRHDGIEVLEAMHRTPGLADVPVLVLSSSPSPRDVARVGAFPNTRYRTKPTVLEEYTQVSEMIREMIQPPGR